MNKTIYCTLDTETFGGASKPKGIYHLAGFIHDRQGNVMGAFNYLIAEHYHEIEADNYAKQNFDRYQKMVKDGIVTMIATEKDAVDMVDNICNYYGVSVMTAFNSGFDYCKTCCSKLIENRDFIDLWLMALETLVIRKKYSTFCHEHEMKSRSNKTCSTSAETVYAYLTGNPNYSEEHTALEDARIEMEIFLACVKTHKAFTKNCHCFGFPDRFGLFPKY